MTRKITMTGRNATYIEHRQAGSESNEKREIIINGDVTVVENDSNGKITPEQYIEQLKKSRRSLEYIRRNIDDAIYNMERRLETGYEVCEDTSRQNLNNAFESVTTLQKILASLSVSTIEY